MKKTILILGSLIVVLTSAGSGISKNVTSSKLAQSKYAETEKTQELRNRSTILVAIIDEAAVITIDKIRTLEHLSLSSVSDFEKQKPFFLEIENRYLKPLSIWHGELNIIQTILSKNSKTKFIDLDDSEYLDILDRYEALRKKFKLQ